MNFKALQIWIIVGFMALLPVTVLIRNPSALLDPMTYVVAAAFGVFGFPFAFFVTGCIVSYQNWRDERQPRNNAKANAEPEILPPTERKRLEG